MCGQLSDGDGNIGEPRIDYFERKICIDRIIQFQFSQFLCFKNSNADKCFGNRCDILNCMFIVFLNGIYMCDSETVLI